MFPGICKCGIGIRTRATALCLSAIFCLTAAVSCTPRTSPVDAPTAVPVATPAPTASPAPTPTPVPPPSDEELALAAGAAFDGALTLDYSQYDLDKEIATIPELMDNFTMFESMAEDYIEALRSAARQAYIALLDMGVTPSLQLDLPDVDWRFMVALSCECEEAPEAKLVRLTQTSVSYQNGTLCISCAPGPFEAFFENEENDVRYSALSIYAYINTAYDPAGASTDSDGSYTFPEGYLDTLVMPLAGRLNLRESWYFDRSNATRRHMGTDIRMRMRTDILSCTSGTVVNAGWGDLAGFYVTVLDETGFYYTYCHMVELSVHVKAGDTVAPGDVIGNVGNTGNSDAPHLHLSIITPEYTYIDPFPVLSAIQ